MRRDVCPSVQRTLTFLFINLGFFGITQKMSIQYRLNAANKRLAVWVRQELVPTSHVRVENLARIVRNQLVLTGRINSAFLRREDDGIQILRIVIPSFSEFADAAVHFVECSA